MMTKQSIDRQMGLIFGVRWNQIPTNVKNSIYLDYFERLDGGLVINERDYAMAVNQHLEDYNQTLDQWAAQVDGFWNSR